MQLVLPKTFLLWKGAGASVCVGCLNDGELLDTDFEVVDFRSKRQGSIVCINRD
jgi:hypothetical protein